MTGTGGPASARPPARARTGWSGAHRRLARVGLVRAGCAAALFASGAAAGVAWQGTGAETPVAVAATAAARAEGLPFRDRYEALRQREASHAGRAIGVLATVPVTVPVRGRLTSSYTHRRLHPVLRLVRPHWGVDIAAPAGTPVVASADGTVLAVAVNETYGLVVDVSHRSGEFITRYAHLSAVLVRAGQRVRRGEPVGRIGSSGLTTGPHLHYELFIHGRRRDPALLFDPADAAGLLP